MMIERQNAKLEYKGKSKDVYGLVNGNVLLVFNDSFTGTDGKEDPGGNTNIGTKAGLGRKNLEISSLLYNQIEKSLGIPTHIVTVDLENNMLEAKRVTVLGGGLEFISRNAAWGSYITRNPHTQEGVCLLDKDGFAFTEVSIKDDAAGDPILTRDQLIGQGLLSPEDFDLGLTYTKQITKFLTALFAKHSMELVDMKVEFGKDKNGKVILVDEISPGSMRVLVNKKLATKDEIYNHLIGGKI